MVLKAMLCSAVCSAMQCNAVVIIVVLPIAAVLYPILYSRSPLCMQAAPTTTTYLATTCTVTQLSAAFVSPLGAAIMCKSSHPEPAQPDEQAFWSPSLEMLEWEGVDKPYGTPSGACHGYFSAFRPVTSDP